MARYEHLPLYKTAMELSVSIETVGGDHSTRKKGEEARMTVEILNKP
jgi:hypothetical protein